MPEIVHTVKVVIVHGMDFPNPTCAFLCESLGSSPPFSQNSCVPPCFLLLLSLVFLAKQNCS